MLAGLYRDLFEYAADFVTPANVRAFVPDDPESPGYYQTFTRILSTRELPPGRPGFDITETIGLTLGDAEQYADADRFRRFRLVTRGVGLIYDDGMSDATVERRRTMDSTRPDQRLDPDVAVLVRQVIERVADQWTMLVLEALEEHGRLRFTEVAAAVGGISQKMLTQTLRQMEQIGLVTRTVHAEVPPRVEYALTDLGGELSEAFCGVWLWAERHHGRIAEARAAFAGRRRR